MLITPGFLGTMLRRHARKHGARVVLFVDQFEELYTLTPDLAERMVFTRCLAGAADDPDSPLRLILSVRSDFIDRVAEDRRFTTELSRSLYFLAPPDRDGLCEALVRPAEMAGYSFESPAMVEQMLDALATTAGALPLLQFAATKLWEARDIGNRLLTEHSYVEIGGIDGALASHADAVLSGLSPPEQALVRAIFVHLVTPERTRILASRNELCQISSARELVGRLIDHLVNARLLVVQTGEDSDDSLVEIVHESLIHSWPRLSHWLDEHQDDIVFIEQLRNVSRRWQAKGRPRGLLWRGEAMEEAHRWRRRYRGKLPALQSQYLHAVFALAARSARRKRLVVAGAFAFLCLLVVAGSIALWKIREAERITRDRLTELQQTIAAKKIAEAERNAARDQASDASAQVRLTEEALREKNRELERANRDLKRANQALETTVAAADRARDEARRESARAKIAAEQAQLATAESRRANARLRVLIAQRERQLAQKQKLIQRLKTRPPPPSRDLPDLK